jgi:hypothetical protein
MVVTADELLISAPEEDIVLMVCPFCLHDIAATWQWLTTHTDELGRPRPQFLPQILSDVPSAPETAGVRITVTVQWLLCQNTECRQVIVQIVRVEHKLGSQAEVPKQESWIALPKKRSIPIVDPLVPMSMKNDYIEAWAILDDSPRMSSVLSRRVLADLLKKYAGLTQYVLAQRIDAFAANAHHPSRLRENLHYLREIGDFSAHTQEQKQVTPEQNAQPAEEQSSDADTVIINVTREEAEWTLKIVADLFDYFVVAPEKDKRLRASFDEKIKAAGRKPI